MDYKTYHNCLRVQITDDELQDERIENIVSHCARYGFDNVMLCINQEEFNVGHIPLDMAKPWIAVLKKAADRLRERGLSVSVNNWIEIGHDDRGRGLFEGQDFQTFVDMDGTAATSIACPLCDNWFEYFSQYAGYIVKEIKPDTFWIEDDFRLHNHGKLRGVGCFCEKHMAYYNKKLGTDYTREEFVKKVFAKGPLNKERKAWLDTNREVMLALADKLAKMIKSASPDTDLAIMTSRPAAHCLEARDWHALLQSLSQGGVKINRIHLPYGEPNGKDFMYNINSMSMAVRALSPKDAVIMPEIEHGSSTFFAKTPRYLRFTLEGAMPLVLSGTTYSIYGFHANGARDSFGFGEVVKSLQPYMQSVRDMDIDFSQLCGVIVPIDEKACYNKEIITDMTDLNATEYAAAGYLSALGMTYRYSTEKSFKGETVFLTGSAADNFSDAQLAALFADNFVIGDVTLVKRLEKRGLSSLVSVTGVKELDYSNGDYSYEQTADDNTVICGVRALRASARIRCLPPCSAVTYDGTVTPLTYIRDHFMNDVCVGIASKKGALLLPFAVDSNNYAMYDGLRRHYIMKAVSEQSAEYVITDSVGVSPYLYKHKNAYVLMLTNANVDTYETIKLETGVELTKIKRLERDGSLEPVEFTKNGTTVVIEKELEYLSTSVFIIE